MFTMEHLNTLMAYFVEKDPRFTYDTGYGKGNRLEVLVVATKDDLCDAFFLTEEICEDEAKARALMGTRLEATVAAYEERHPDGK